MSLQESNRLDNVKFHIKISVLLVISPQVLPDPQHYWKQ